MRMSLIGAWVRGGCSDEEVRHLAVLAGVTALILGVGTFALCACSRASRVLSATASSLRGRVTVLVFVSGRAFPHRLRVAAWLSASRVPVEGSVRASRAFSYPRYTRAPPVALRAVRGAFVCFSVPVRVCGFVLESELGEGGLSWRVQRRRGDVWPVAGEIDWDDLNAFFDFREELHLPDASFPFAPTFERCFSVFADFVCECGVVAECEDGSGLAVDAAGRWYRDGALVENMVEAVGDAGEPVMITDDEFCGSVVSNAETDVRIHAGRINDLVNVGCDANHGDGMNMSMIGDVTVERAFGVSVGYVGDDAHIGLLTGHRGPGDDSPFGVLSQVDDMRDRAVIDTVTGDTRIFGMMHESRVGVVDGGASVDEMSGKSRIDVVACGGGVDYMLGDASVGKVRGRASMMRDRSHVDYVMDGGFVEEVHDDASVDSVTFRGRVKGVYEGGRVALVDAGGVVERVSGSARVGSVDSGGRVNKVDGKGAAVMNVGSGGRVGAVTDGGVVVDVGISDATEPCVVESVDSSSKVSLLDCWADVTYECGESNVSAARAREFVVKRLSDDATGIGGECLARANGDNPFERSNVRVRVRDAEGRVVGVPDVDGVLSALTEVDDDERELMWESMMGSPNSK